MTKPETMFKATMVSQVRKAGGYARRLEDQFAVGLPDCIFIPVGGLVFFVEAKIIRSPKWGPTPRQKLELDKINATGSAFGLVVGLDKEYGSLHLKYLGYNLMFPKPWDMNKVLEAMKCRITGK